MKKFIRFVVTVLLAALVVASIGWYLFVFDRDFTRDMLLHQARFHDLHGNSRMSAWFYDLAYSHSGKDENVAIELANQYKSDRNYTKAEVTLSNAINAGATAELYTALCKTYVEQDKLMDAVALLNSISDPAIKAELDALRPTTPVSDHQPGFYSQYIKVSLSSSSGTLLYTTTGEYPSIADTPYSEPIRLPGGETVIYCISVDNSGLVSNLSVIGYTVGGVIEPAVFMDANMEQAVRDTLGTDPNTLLYTNDLWNITEFTVPENVRLLEDLAMMTNLESLTVNSRQLESLSDFASLGALRSLNLSGCRFPASELAVIAKLPLLTELLLSDCGLSTIADLEGANKLEILDLSSNTIRNLEVIESMTALKELYLQHNAVIALNSMKPLTNLEHLDVSYNALTNLSPLAACVHLKWLDAAYNQITSVDGLDELPLLSSLSLNYNGLVNIYPLGACLQLTELSISNNQISDITCLVTLTKLEVFDVSYNSLFALPNWPEGCALRIIDCSHNSIGKIDVLGKMASLTYVSADYNQITSVDALEKCNNLVQVNVYGNAIKDVSALTSHNIIVNWDPT